MNRRVGACSWSLRPRGPGELAVMLESVGVRAVQLALGPLRTGLWDVARTVGVLGEAGVEIRSGMMETIGEDYSSLESIARTGGLRPDEHWDGNRVVATETARLARRLRLDLVTFHAGFLPERAGDPERERLLERLREVVDLFGEEGVQVAFESGQETAATLLDVLEELDRPEAGVNFDPANMILYDKDDPLDAFELLAPRVRQIHVKDARRTTTPGTWGLEVPVGEGDVDWAAFFGLLRRSDVAYDLMIEREAGEQRISDARRAREVVERHLAEAGDA